MPVICLQFLIMIFIVSELKRYKMKKEKRAQTRSFTLYNSEDIQNVDKIYHYLLTNKLVISRLNKLSPVQYALKKCVEMLEL